MSLLLLQSPTPAMGFKQARQAKMVTCVRAIECVSVCLCVWVQDALFFQSLGKNNRFGDFSLSDMILPGLMLQVCEDLSLSVSSHQWHKIFHKRQELWDVRCEKRDVMSLSAKSGSQ